MKVMRLVLLMTGLLASRGALAAETQNCALKILAGLEMQALADGRVTIPVTMEGHDYQLMVDTGGFINTVTPYLARREGYKPQFSLGTTMRGMGTTRLATYVTVGDFTIGTAHGRNFKFFVDDFTGMDVDGTLAPQVLENYDVDLDFGHGQFKLVSPDHCDGRVVYWTSSQPAIVPIEIQGKTHIRIPITIDGKPMMALLDTGAHTSFITMRAAERNLGITGKDTALKSRGNISVNGMAGQVYNYPFKTLSFGGVTVNNPHIEMVEDKVWDNGTDLLLGIVVLRQMHMYIAYKERKLYLTPAMAN